MRALALVALLASAGTASADDVVKRPVPDYDGREPPPTTAGDVLLWVPRIIVSPLYLTSEYLVRKPIGFAVVEADRHRVVPRVEHFLGLDRDIGFVPTFYYDLSAHPHFGVYAFWNNFIEDGNDLRATFSAGQDYLGATVTDRYAAAQNLTVGLRGHWESRSDAVFYGIGPDTVAAHRARYEVRRFDGNAFLDFGPAERRLHLELGERDVKFGSDGCCNDPSVMDAVPLGWFPLPPGFADGGYYGPYLHASLTLDTRERLPATGAGLILDGDLGTDLAGNRSWVRSGLHVGGGLDLGNRRVITLSGGATLAGRLAGQTPFTELVVEGGSTPFAGFNSGQLLGASEVDVMAGYEWPIWAFAAGASHVTLGNTFGSHFEGFDTRLLRMSADIGIRQIGSIDHRIQILLAVGTTQIDRGFGIETVRLEIGGVTGF